MSGIPNQEPQAYGLITFKTTFGEIDIELFTKQCPKATRNFVQLCLDDYYRGTLFERVEKDFIAIGGSSSRGDVEELEGSFADEFHSRLKFTRRGLLATANEGKDENGAKFFFTLGATPELQDKHTIFGRAKGNSIYTLVELNECQVDDDCRPYSEQKIEQVIVIENPFQDLVPRLRSVNTEIENSDSSSEEEYFDPLSKPKGDSVRNKRLSFYPDDDDSESENEEPTFSKSSSCANHETRAETDDLRDKSDEGRSDTQSNVVVIDNETNIDNSRVVQDEIISQVKNTHEDKEKRLQELKAQFEAIKAQVENNVGTKKTSKRRRNGDTHAPEAELESLDDRTHLDIEKKTGKDRQRETIELVTRFKKKLKQVSTVDRNLQAPEFDQVESHLDEMDELDRVDGDDWLNHRFEPDEDDSDQDVSKRNTDENHEHHKQISNIRHRSEYSGHSSRHRNHHNSSRSSRSHRH